MIFVERVEVDVWCQIFLCVSWSGSSQRKNVSPRVVWSVRSSRSLRGSQPKRQWPKLLGFPKLWSGITVRFARVREANRLYG
jgi:hypothetical protein